MTAAELLAISAMFIGACAQSITGIGFSLICAPLLTLALGGGDGVRLANVLAGLIALALVCREWKQVDLRSVLTLLVPASIAAPLTAMEVNRISPDGLSIASGALVLLAVIVLARGVRIKQLVGLTGAVVAGLVSGAMNVVGGVAGPAIASYALNAEWKPSKMRATLSAYFVGINVVSVLARGLPMMSGNFAAACAITVLAGMVAGSFVARYLDKSAVRIATLSLAAFGGSVAVIHGLQ